MASPSKQPLAPANANTVLNRVSIASLLEKPQETPAAQSAKRKASEIEEIDSDDERLNTIDKNCNQVRLQIRNFLNTGEMKVTEFQRAIGASSKTYNNFMGQNGPDKGSGSSVYYNAFAFFKKRELQGIKIPKKKAKPAVESAKNDVSGVQLEGEAEQNVPVYDSCDEIRKKINAYLREPGITQAGFLREIAKSFPEGKKIQSKVLNDFLGKKGALAGNTSAVFYGSYVFFEKMRVRDGKSKSKHRLTMEEEYKDEKGLDVKNRSRDRCWVRADEHPWQDKYGKIHIEGRF